MKRYIEFEVKSKIMTDWIKKGKIRKKKDKITSYTYEENEERFKNEKEDKEERFRKEEEEKKEELRRAKGKVRTEEKYFRRRIQQNIEDIIHEGRSFVDDIQRDISNIKELRKCYF